MPAFDAPGKSVSLASMRRLERRCIGNSRDRARRVCRGNFPEHALRHRRDPAWIDPARQRHFFYWISSLDSTVRNGVFTPAFMFGGAGAGPSPFWPAQHGGGRVLRDPGGPGRRFCNPDLRTLPASARRWRVASRGHCHLSGKTWPRRFFWRAHHRRRFSGSGSERLDGFLAARRAHCHRHFLRRSFYVHDFVSLRSRTADTAQS